MGQPITTRALAKQYRAREQFPVDDPRLHNGECTPKLFVFIAKDFVAFGLDEHRMRGSLVISCPDYGVTPNVKEYLPVLRRYSLRDRMKYQVILTAR
jgi:hypothetical protein